MSTSSGETMPTNATIAGLCHICQQAVSGDRIRQHLVRCISERTGLQPAQNPQRRGRRNARKTAHISVRAPGRPHWMELGVRCDATLRELDRFLRAVWLECCGHLSHFTINGVEYSIMVPMPGENRYFEPESEREESWRHMGKSINAAIPPLITFHHEFDYGSTTELELEYVAVFGELVQLVSPTQPWHGGKIVLLARNQSQQSCLCCGRPAYWKFAPQYDEYEDYDDELYEDEGVLCEDDLDPITFCEECAPAEGDFIPLANSPRAGVNCYDNTHSWPAWPLPEYGPT